MNQLITGATSNPFKWAARNRGVESNAIKVAIIDQGADVTLTLNGALSVSTIGTQVVTASGMLLVDLSLDTFTTGIQQQIKSP